jgi:flagellar protein FlaG
MGGVISSIAVPAKEQEVAALYATNPDSNTDKKNNLKTETKPPQNTELSLASVKDVTKESMEHIAKALESYIEANQRSLKISVQQATGHIIIKVISTKDGKVIREIPPEKMLDLVAKIEEFAGTLFNETA